MLRIFHEDATDPLMFLANVPLALEWHLPDHNSAENNGAGRKGRSDHVEGLADCKHLRKDGGLEVAQLCNT